VTKELPETSGPPPPTTFSALRRQKAKQQVPSIPRRGTNRNLGRGGRVVFMRVLVVDDEVLIVLLTSAWLEDLGCEVETAVNGGEALAKLGTDQDIQVLITDVNMPGLSGYQVAHRAKEMRPDLQVILISGAESDPKGWRLLRKPIQQHDLIRAMADVGAKC